MRSNLRSLEILGNQNFETLNLKNLKIQFKKTNFFEFECAEKKKEI